MMVPCIHAAWKSHWYVYVPGVVSVAVNVLPLTSVGETPGRVAPGGAVRKWTLWGATVSSSVQVIVVPDATVKLVGEKFCPLPAP